jgi:hypothetical protein
MIKKMVEAMNGDIHSFGEFCDMVFYDNKLWFWSLFASINQKSHTFGLNDRSFTNHNEPIKKELFERHTKVLFDRIYNLTEEKKAIKVLFNKHEMDFLLMHLIWRDNPDINSEDLITDWFTSSNLEMKETLKEMLLNKDHADYFESIFTNPKFKGVRKVSKIPVFSRNMNILPDQLLSFLAYQTPFTLHPIPQIAQLQNADSLITSYGYTFLSSEICLNLNKFFQLLLKVSQNEEKAVNDLIRICYGVFMNIPAATEILLVAKLWYKKKKEYSVEEITIIVSLLMITTYDFAKLRSPGLMVGNPSNYNDVRNSSKLIRLIMLIISKNISSKDNAYIKRLIEEAFECKLRHDYYLYVYIYNLL